MSVQKSIGHLDDLMASPKSVVNSQTIKQLESKIEEMSMTQQRIVHENTGLKITVEASERAARENESLRVANSQYQIEFDRLVQEIQERDNDEQRYSLQVNFFQEKFFSSFSFRFLYLRRNLVILNFCLNKLKPHKKKSI